ncbi:uncharacterized protein LOC124142804 isoform X2 [Haliotis rufescens]|uniref:uncharacterized protein LOC124142804 isoform X2 n=1 Tax=Haliotis rufescens TaxID=6454 RepID=UPI00201F1487|nr:uncharacterized protein LOC124142804 isoform X2 [Haliotis rufescens]
MFPAILVIVLSLLKASSCAPSAPVSGNDPGGHRCYSCASVDKPYLCNVTTQCRPNEQCYTDEYSINQGLSYFSVGCRRVSECHAALVGRSDPSRRDVKRLKCVECCHGNLCNAGGCSAGLGKGNVCYSCSFINDPRRCEHVTRCQADENCYIEKMFTEDFNIKYNLGCVGNGECETLRQLGQPVGKRDKAISTMCATCCYGDKCNDVCFVQGITTSSPPMTEDTTVVHTTSGMPYTSPSMIGKGNVCYSCSFINDPRRCEQVTRCQADENCYIEKMFTEDFNIKYNLGCVGNGECETLRQFGPPVGKRDKAISTMCATCCYGDKCNDVCFVQGITSGQPSTSKNLSTTQTSYVTSTPPMRIDTAVVDTSYASPSMGIDTAVVDIPYASPSMRIDTIVVDTSYVSPSMSIDTTVVDTTIDASSTSPLMRTDTTVVDTSYASASMNMATTVVDATNEAHSSPNPKSTVYALSTMGHTATVSPSTSTTPSKSTHGTSPGNAPLSIVCQADCDGGAECTFLATSQRCSSQAPYCFTQIDNDDLGNYDIRKGCADRNTCNTKWWKQTSDEDLCVNFKPGIMSTFTCSYCCTSDRCNFKNVIPTVSLFKGTD